MHGFCKDYLSVHGAREQEFEGMYKGVKVLGSARGGLEYALRVRTPTCVGSCAGSCASSWRRDTAQYGMPLLNPSI